MKRRWLLSILLCISLFLCGCASGDGQSQFTQLDSKYLEKEQETNSEELTAQNLESQEPETSEAVSEKDADKAIDEQKLSDAEEDDSANVDKGEVKKKSEKTEKSTSQTASKKTQLASAKAEKKNTSSKKSTKKDESNQKTSDKNKSEKTEVLPTATPAVTNKNYCTISIDCQTILSNLPDLKDAKKEFVPEDGWILKNTQVTFAEGDTAYDVLYKVCREQKIHMEAAYTPAYGTYYVEGIHQLYEFDCGDLSGWTFLVNGKSLNFGASKYKVQAGDEIQWRFSCNAGRDVR